MGWGMLRYRFQSSQDDQSQECMVCCDSPRGILKSAHASLVFVVVGFLERDQCLFAISTAPPSLQLAVQSAVRTTTKYCLRYFSARSNTSCSLVHSGSREGVGTKTRLALRASILGVAYMYHHRLARSINPALCQQYCTAAQRSCTSHSNSPSPSHPGLRIPGRNPQL